MSKLQAMRSASARLSSIFLHFYLTQHANLARTAFKLATQLLSCWALTKSTLEDCFTYNSWFFQQLLKLLTCYHATPWKQKRADSIFWKRFCSSEWPFFRHDDISSADLLSCRRLTAHWRSKVRINQPIWIKYNQQCGYISPIFFYMHINALKQ